MADPEAPGALTYPAAQVGVTLGALARGDPHVPLPPGYGRLRVRTRLGTGAALWAAAGSAVLDWRMHRALGVSIETTAPRAVPGARVTVGLGVGRLRLRAPCQVVRVVADGTRTGFAYGTLPGHPESGEEGFLVERDRHGTVYLTVTALSRPARWFLRVVTPAVRAFQWAYARRCGAVLRRLARRAVAMGEAAAD